ncbi:MAG: type IV toxin-antitoxin system AbiEi family antitoxin domain-containing protein [Propionibacteriaceae bacterium]|nr:type IV toxin-antitoxin system AbiEi family antitoxin domain-containing protein [Propionibacteriaceae bacterium]
MSVKRTRQLNAAGQSPKVRARMARAGELVVVRHGAYADAPPAGALDRHRRLIEGTVPLLGEATVLSHVSAGVLHGLPSWESMLGRVSVVRRSNGHGSRRRYLHVMTAPLTDREVVDVDGLMVTSIVRTAIDLACSLDFERAVAVLDAALHLGGDPLVLADILARAARRRGVITARAALKFADGRSESVGESVSRVRMAAAGLPMPELQLNVFDGLGGWLARPDFCWEEFGVLGEFDGQIKYQGTREEVSQAVMQEKRREARLREAGWGVVRWDWADLGNPRALRRRIESAFDQARPAGIRGCVAPSDAPSNRSRSRSEPSLPEFREQGPGSGAGGLEDAGERPKTVAADARIRGLP